MDLRRLVAWLERILAAAGGPPAPSSGFVSAGLGPVSRPASLARVLEQPSPIACLVSVDDAGQCLLVARERLTLGHVRSAQADLLFLADVGPLHAELARVASLREGPGWEIARAGGERILVNEEPVQERRKLLCGERVRLGENLEFVFLVPDPSSASACLQLLGSAECWGARRIVLLDEGEGGRVRIGAAEGCHLRVPTLEPEVRIVKRGEHLEVSVERAGNSVRSDRLAFPPAARVDLCCGAPRGSRPPFGLSFEPVLRAGPGGPA